MFRLTIRKLPTPAGGTLIGGHLSLFSPLAKHKFEEKNSTQLGAIYRQRYLARQVVVVADPVLQQEVQLLLLTLPHSSPSRDSNSSPRALCHAQLAVLTLWRP